MCKKLALVSFPLDIFPSGDMMCIALYTLPGHFIRPQLYYILYLHKASNGQFLLKLSEWCEFNKMFITAVVVSGGVLLNCIVLRCVSNIIPPSCL